MGNDFLKDWDKGGFTEAHLSEKPKTQHTPGPWQASQKDADGSHGIFAVIEKKDRRENIGWVYGLRESSEAQANARLIAAAPGIAGGLTKIYRTRG